MIKKTTWTSILAYIAAGAALGVVVAGCAHQAATTMQATAQNAPEPLPLEQASDTVTPYTVIDQLPPTPAVVSRSCQKLTLVHHDDRLCLEDAAGQYFDCGRDRNGHIDPVYYDRYSDQWCPLYYDGDRNSYYCVVQRNDHYYREYYDNPRCLYYDHEFDYADYSPPSYDRPVIVVSSVYYHQGYHHGNDWLSALPLIAVAFIALDNGGGHGNNGWHNNGGYNTGGRYYAHRSYPSQPAAGWWTAGHGTAPGSHGPRPAIASNGHRPGGVPHARYPTAAHIAGLPGSGGHSVQHFAGKPGVAGHPARRVAGRPGFGGHPAQHVEGRPGFGGHPAQHFAGHPAQHVAARPAIAGHSRPAARMAHVAVNRRPAGPGPRASHAAFHPAPAAHAAFHPATAVHAAPRFQPQRKAAAPRMAFRPGGHGPAPRQQSFHRNPAPQGTPQGRPAFARPQPHVSAAPRPGSGGQHSGGFQPRAGGAGSGHSHHGTTPAASKQHHGQ